MEWANTVVGRARGALAHSNTAHQSRLVVIVFFTPSVCTLENITDAEVDISFSGLLLW